MSHDRQGVLVGTPVDFAAPGLLGRHVVGCPQDGSRARELSRSSDRLGDTEVGEDHATILIDHDVGRFDVPMDHSAPVSVAEGEGSLAQDVPHLRYREWASARQLLERVAGDVLHHDVDESRLAFDSVDRNDVRVIQLGGRLCFLLKTADQLWVAAHVGGKHLDGHFPFEHQVPREIHRRHAASAQKPNDLIAPLESVGQPLSQFLQLRPRGVTMGAAAASW